MTQVSKINGISIPNTSITAYTYDGVNTFTINQSDGVSFTATINELSATTFNGVTFSGGTFYGDGSNLTGIVGVSDTYTTGATFTNNIITFTNSTGGTYTVLLNNFSGLTVNGDTNTTGNILSGGTNIDTLFTTDAFTTFSSTTAGEGSVVAVTRNDQINFSGVNVNILTNDTDKTITFSASTGGGTSQTQAEVAIDFSFDGTYVQGSTSFGQIPLQVVIQSATTYNSGFPTMSGTLICDVSQTDSGINGEFDLYNLTDSAQVTGSVTSFTDTDGLKSSASFSLGSGDFDDTFRVRMRRTSGTGANDVRIRAAQLILTLT
jgi:hypothetical protein